MTNRSESTRSRAQDAGAGQARDGVRRRERRIARSQVWDSARGSGVATPDPHPSAPSAGTVYLNSWPLGNPLGDSRSQIPRSPSTHRVHTLDSQAQKSRSLGRSCGRLAVLLYTASWWRKARFSQGERAVATAEEREESEQVEQRADHGRRLSPDQS